MGHSEMLLAVAGQNESQIQTSVERLARGDWASFTPAEQYAFAYVRKAAKTPWLLERRDFTDLERHFGTARAADVVWWACRCHYMTRVADAFQLPLETENVFE
jgi:hypothetical protein